MTIDPAKLQKELAGGRLAVDVLPDEAFNQRRIPGACNSCIYEVAFLEKIEEVTGGDKAKPLAVYDETGTRESARLAAARLAEAGYSDIKILEGGMQAWTRAGLPVESPDQAGPHRVADGDYPLDCERSLIEWTGRNIGNKHWGSLKIRTGEISVASGGLAGGRIVIDMQSMACDDITDPKTNGFLIEHLKSADFFEVDTWPEAILEITAAQPLDAESEGLPNTRIIASLALHGETHPVEFDCLLGHSMDGDLVAQGSFDIDRTHWNIRYGSGRFFEWLANHLVNDLIGLQIKMVVSKQSLA